MDWEIIFIVGAIVYSIWAEVNKKKKEEKELDFDFSELSSIDDILKQEPNLQPAEKDLPSNVFAAARKEKKNRREKKSREKKPSSLSHLEQPLSSHDNYDRMEGRKDVNYDKLPTLTGDRAEGCIINEDSMRSRYGRKRINMNINRKNIIQAFVMSEVMRRYDISRIYERIPGVNNDSE